MTAYEILWYLFIYAFFGWCGEVMFAAVKHRRFVNRGFLCGPVCPIYGFGAVSVLLCLEPLKYSVPLTFLGAALVTTLLEFLTGLVLERVFHQKWWDYSGTPLNIMGYVCLPFSIVWGAACLVVVYFVQPMLSGAVGIIPHALGTALLCCFGAAFAVDGTLTVLSLMKLNRRIKELDRLESRMRTVSDAVGETLAERTMEAADRLEKSRESAKEKLEAADARLEKRRGELSQTLKEIRDRREEIQSRLRELAEEKLPAAKRLSRAFPQLDRISPEEIHKRISALADRLNESREGK